MKTIIIKLTSNEKKVISYIGYLQSSIFAIIHPKPKCISNFKAGMEAQLAQLSAIRGEELEAHDKGFEEGVVKGTEAAESTFGAQIDDLRAQIAFLDKKLDDREADLVNAKKEGREEVFTYLENDAPELAASIRQALKESK